MCTDKEKRAHKHSMYSCSCSSSTAVNSRRSWHTLLFCGFGCAATSSLLHPSPHLFFFHLYSLRLLSVPPSLLIAVQIWHKQSIAAEPFLLDHKKSNATHACNAITLSKQGRGARGTTRHAHDLRAPERNLDRDWNRRGKGQSRKWGKGRATC